MFIITLVMDVELSLLKFINHYTTHNRDDNGEEYSEDQANLILTFCHSIGEKIHPKIFDKNITENKMKLKSKNKKNGEFVKISLSHLEKLHFKLLYSLAYIKWYYPSKISKFNLSEDLAELLNDEDKIINLYKEIKQIGLN